MGTSARQIEETYSRWLTETDEQLRGLLDAYDCAGGAMIANTAEVKAMAEDQVVAEWIDRFALALMTAWCEERRERQFPLNDEGLVRAASDSLLEDIPPAWLIRGRIGDQVYIVVATEGALVLARYDDGLEFQFVREQDDQRYSERWTQDGALELRLQSGVLANEPLVITGHLTPARTPFREAQTWLRNRAGL